MFAYVKEIQSLLIALIICILLLIFRAEVRKVVNWIVSFKRLSKTKDGYEASSDTGPHDLSTRDEIKSKIKIESTNTDKADNGNENEYWISAFFKKDYTTAHNLLKEEIEREHDKKSVDILLGQLGLVKFMMNKEDGVKYFEFAISEGKVNSDLFYWYAFSYYINYNYGAVVKIVKKGIDLSCTSPSLYRLYAESLFEMGRGVDSIEVLAGEIHRNPEEASYYVIATEILTKLDMKSLARECCMIGLAMNPNEESLLKKHADVASEMELYKEAMQSYRRLTQLAPSNQQYWTLLGNQYLQLKLTDLALKAYRKGNELAAEKEGWIIGNIGNLVNNQGFHSEAADYLKSALLLEPNSQYAHERLASALKAAKEQEEERNKITGEVQGLLREYRTMDAIVADVRSSRRENSGSADG